MAEGEVIYYNNDLFPAEILEKIFKYLFYSDFKACLQVCRRWNEVGSFLREEICKNECAVKYNAVYKDAYRRGRLSWEALLKSLNMWSDVTSGYVIRVYMVVLTRHVHHNKKSPHMLQFLRDGILSYPRLSVDKPRGSSFYNMGDCNAITYLDAYTLRVINSVQYNFVFNMYVETDDFIVFREKNLSLRVFTKVDNQLHRLGKVCSGVIYRGASRFYVVGYKIFFITDDHKIWMITYSCQNGRGVLYKEAIVKHWEEKDRQTEILAIACPDKNVVKVLTSRGYVFTIVNGEGVKRSCLATCSETGGRGSGVEVAGKLAALGFDWAAPRVLAWVAPFDNTHLRKRGFCMMDNAAVYLYGDLVIVGTKRDNLMIYYNPYRNGKLALYEHQPTVSMMLRELQREQAAGSPDQSQLMQIGVVEINNGHRVYLLYAKKIMVLDVTTGGIKRRDGRLRLPSCSHAKIIKLEE